MKFVFQVINNEAIAPLTINTKLIRYKSDLSIAEPIFFQTHELPMMGPVHGYIRTHIKYLGINYDEKTLIAKSQYRLTHNIAFVEIRFGGLPRGNYRFEISSTADEDDELYKARDFGVKYKYYPALKTPRALARPLAYLMDEDEYDELMNISDSQKLKNAVCHFWLSHIEDEKKARQVMNIYYMRVAEANKWFSNFKAGWKTDRGLVYILFGPPRFIWNLDLRYDEAYDEDFIYKCHDFSWKGYNYMSEFYFFSLDVHINHFHFSSMFYSEIGTILKMPTTKDSDGSKGQYCKVLKKNLINIINRDF